MSARVLLWLCSCALLGCARPDTGRHRGPPAAKPGRHEAAAPLPDRNSELAHRLVRQGAVRLDVRTPGEFAGRHIEGAVNISHDALPQRLGEIDALSGNDTSTPIVVYCRSSIAKTLLVDHGDTQVTNLGAMTAW